MPIKVTWLRELAVGFEVGGLIVLLLSGTTTLFKWAKRGLPEFWLGERAEEERLRVDFGRQIVFSLEFFISADIVRSIQAPTFQELGKLAIIVLIRTILHYSLRS